MPPKKSSVPPRAPLPPPDLSHPCASLLPTVLDPESLPLRPHPASYHVFLRSEGATSTRRRDVQPPKKKKAKQTHAGTVLADPVEGAWTVKRVQDKLLAWFEGKREGRGMPWRKDGRPEDMTREERSQRGYEVWVSEIMLQQTQVATVIPYFLRWIDKFPTVVALSEASLDEVNSVWTGLGYYSRAKRLLEGAKTVVSEFGSLVPESVDDLLRIDGIGPYSAGAISSIAFGKRSPLVDGNVTRVLSRLTALHAAATAKSTTTFVWALADLLVPEQSSPLREPELHVEPGSSNEIKNRPGSWNQGLMELGATVCTPKNPKCGECPIATECLAYQEARFVSHRKKSLEALASSSSSRPLTVDLEDLCTLCSPLPDPDDGGPSSNGHSVEVYPMAKERKKPKEEETAVCIVEWVPPEARGKPGLKEHGQASIEGKKVLVFKRPEKGLLAGLFEFPSVDLPPSADPSTSTARTRHVLALLRSLIVLPPDFGFSVPPTPTLDADEAQNRVGVTELDTEFEPVVHVYSHIVRTYHPIRVVLTSPTLPKLRKPPRSVDSGARSSGKAKKSKRREMDDDDDEPDESGGLVQSVAGQGKWLNFVEVEGESLGGAMKKIWDVRVNGAVKGPGRGGKARNGKEAAKGGAKGSAKVSEKGQKSLIGFFKTGGSLTAEKRGKASSEDTRRDANPGVDVGEDDDADDDVIVEEPKGSEAARKAVAGVREAKKEYKKRRIAPASDEEDEA
ncbi:hypothetical protein JCM10212_000315 [Sporobolomyces blumeae]